jgi:tRNA nucleotidyltransferase (CCA-adding enzyme)
MDHLDIVRRLCDNNCDTYIVGGGIRDMLLGNNPDDYDVVTEATPDKVLELFKDCKVKQVGKSFGVILVEGYEVATFRHDRYKDSKCIVSFADTIHEDLGRRDLTVNAMAFCELTGELIDDHGGREDLENRVIKFVGNPTERIDEDPCRILRACRFLAKIDGSFSLDTFNALNWAVVQDNLINEIAPERIRMEILKAMKTQIASQFFEALHMIGALKEILPSLASCWKHEHGAHHKEDVFEHCMYAGNAITTEDSILKLTGYLHDVGKPFAFENGKFINHEIIGRNLIREELKKLTFTTDEINRICGLVRLHMNSIQRMSPKAIRKLLRRFDEYGVVIDDFIVLRKADRKANIAREDFTAEEWEAMEAQLKCEIIEEKPFNIHSLAFKGGDIIKEFSMEPGPMIGKLQEMMLDYIIEVGQEFNTYTELRTVVANALYLKLI